MTKEMREGAVEALLKKIYSNGHDEWQSNSYVARDSHHHVHIAARDIDLIADLVVERIKIWLREKR